MAKIKSCYDCKHFALCRLREKATELATYYNQTGNPMGNGFISKLHDFVGSWCKERKEAKNGTE